MDQLFLREMVVHSRRWTIAGAFTIANFICRNILSISDRPVGYRTEFPTLKLLNQYQHNAPSCHVFFLSSDTFIINLVSVDYCMQLDIRSIISLKNMNVLLCSTFKNTIQYTKCSPFQIYLGVKMQATGMAFFTAFGKCSNSVQATPMLNPADSMNLQFWPISHGIPRPSHPPSIYGNLRASRSALRCEDLFTLYVYN